MEAVADFIFLGSKIPVDGDCRHEIKRHLLLGRKTDKPRQHIKEQRHHFADKVMALLFNMLGLSWLSFQGASVF